MASDNHERFVALEWLVQRLAIEICLLSPNPRAAADKIVDDGEQHSTGLFHFSLKSGNDEHSATALSVGAAISMLTEHLPDDVQHTLDVRAQMHSQTDA